jgi:hypothetical protein
MYPIFDQVIMQSVLPTRDPEKIAEALVVMEGI